MAIKLTTNLDIRTNLPIDTRFVLSFAKMRSMDDDLMPKVYFAIGESDAKLYVYNKNNPIDTITGKFRIYESGGGSSTDTKYRIVSDGTNKWKLQKSTDGISWEDAEGIIDLSTTIATIQNQIATEITNRTNADLVLQSNIEEEASLREQEDIRLQEEIDEIPTPAEYTIIEKAPPTGFTATYRLTKDGTEVGASINVPEPQIIKSVTVRTVTSEDDPAHTQGGIPIGDKCIDFTWSNDTHSYINVKDLVVAYTAGAGITISPENVISVNTDDNSIITVVNGNHLSIKGYEQATQGQMLVKDTTEGLTWVKPLDSSQLDQAVAAATAQAQQSGAYATAAGNSASAANTSAQQAQRINEQTMNFVNQKFWWGTIEEYNQLEELNEGTFYFVQT